VRLRPGLAQGACFVLSLGAALASASGFASVGGATETAATARVIDRTFVCSIGHIAGGREIEIHARSGFRSLQNPSQWQMLPYAEVGPLGRHVVSISAGRPREKHRDTPYDNGPFGSRLAVGVTSCEAARANVSLSARGLTGGPASQLGEVYDCPTPRKQILVRVRAVFRTPTSLRLRGGYDQRAWSTSGTVRESPREASFAVRTRGGKPLALAAVFESGKARLFTAPSCIAE
jgi:hypothetical protein